MPGSDVGCTARALEDKCLPLDRWSSPDRNIEILSPLRPAASLRPFLRLDLVEGNWFQPREFYSNSVEWPD